MSEPAERWTISEVSRRVGVPARTIRFWSDVGVLPPTDRSASGYRRYDQAAVARLSLVRTLRELGLSLDDTRAVLRGRKSVSEIASTHAAALDAQIRLLRLRRAVLRAVAARCSNIEETRLMNDLANLSAQERQQIIDEFVDHTFADVDSDAASMRIAAGMRAMPAELPDDPTETQLDAWIELAGLVADEPFRRRAREMALAGASGEASAGQTAPDPNAVADVVGRALADGIDPGSKRAQAMLDELIPASLPSAERARLIEQLETFTDERVERYWQLIGVLNGHQPRPPMVPNFRWLIAALRART